MGRFIALCVFAVLLAACSLLTPGRTAFADLEPEVKELIVPDTASWAGGVVCDGFGDCDQLESFEQIDGAFWTRVDRVLKAEVGSGQSTLVMQRKSDAGTNPTSDEIGVRIRGGDIGRIVQSAFDQDLEVWAGSIQGYPTTYPTSYLLVFDAQGRVTSIGHGSAQVLSEPIARLSATADMTPRDYFLESVYVTPPQRLLAAEDPGRAIEVFTPRRLIAEDRCVRYGREGPTLVFPMGTVKERGYLEKGIDVIDKWSGLRELPLTSVIGKTGRVEVVGQPTTLTDLGVNGFDLCPDEAIFVTEMRVIPAS